MLHREFPQQARRSWPTRPAAATFLKLMGASLALAGVGGCTRQPAETIVPYVTAARGARPGQAAVLRHGDAARRAARAGVLVESHMGRPTKVEGNPEHPASLGATDAFAQASILDALRPRPLAGGHARRGEISTWDDFVGRAAAPLDGAARRAGRRAADPDRDGHLADAGRQIDALLERVPAGEVASVRAGRARRRARRRPARLRRGRRAALPTSTRPTSSSRSTPTSSAAGPAQLRYARDFAARRRVGDRRRPAMNRLYVVESTPTITGAMADHRLPLRAARRRGVRARRSPRRSASPAPRRRRAPAAHAALGRRRCRATCRRTAAGRSSSPATRQPAAVHALAHAINARARQRRRDGRLHRRRSRPSPATSSQSLRELVDDMDAGQVDAARDPRRQPGLHRAGRPRLRRARWTRCGSRVHLGLYDDETSRALPLARPRGALPRVLGRRCARFDGTASISSR